MLRTIFISVAKQFTNEKEIKNMKCYTMEARKFETKLNEAGITYNQFQELHKMWDELMDSASRAEVDNMLRTYDDDVIVLDHADIVTSHKCNNNCPHCIDKFLHTSNKEVSYSNVAKFLRLLRQHTDKPLEVLLLGGEPTMLDEHKLMMIASLIKINGFVPIMSTNGRERDKIIALTKHYQWIQVTVNNDADIDYWKPWSDRINIKLAGDSRLTMDKLNHFIEYTKDFERRSVSMYFTEDFEELCKDEEVWTLLDTLEWQRNGSYMYAFYKGVRFKKCIPGETNIIDEPSVPKLYPNGNYNKTWCNEDMDPYLGEMK